jgi:hypothetical protein
MNTPLMGLRVACVVFAIVSLIQLARLVTGVEISVDGHLIPLWTSGIAFVFAGCLSLWMGRLSSRGAN